ncbi:MAG: recombinase family protein [Nitrosomonas sp.]|nr:MAG: recombinase family protein [Nitrosomonas sp.]
MKLGYARVSTDEQTTRLQRDALEQAGCERIYEETASGSKEQRPELLKLLDHAREGDVVIVWRLDRLARSLRQLINTASLLRDRGVELRSLTEQIDTTSPAGKLTFHLFGAMAEFERDLIRERVQAGLTAARARGKKGGRKFLMSEEDKKKAVVLLQSGKFSVGEVAESLKVSRSTLYRNVGVVQIQKPVDEGG